MIASIFFMSDDCLAAVLRHHDDGRLDGGNQRQEQVQQDEGVGIEGLASGAEQQHRVDHDPQDHSAHEDEDEGPGAAKGRDPVRQPLPEAAAFLETRAHVARDRDAPGHTLDHVALPWRQVFIADLEDPLGQKLHGILWGVVHGAGLRSVTAGPEVRRSMHPAHAPVHGA
jgi:hypothetical protein